MSTSRSRQLSLARKQLKEDMAEMGASKLLLSVQATDPAWLPLGLLSKQFPSPVRVTRKGVPKHKRKWEAKQSVHKGDHRTPPTWW